MKKTQTRKVGVSGGFINQMMGNNTTEPKVGEGATILLYSDRHAYEVISVSEDGNECTIRPMKTKFIGQSYGDERYEYSSDPDGITRNLEWNEKKQCWGEVWNTIEIQKSIVKKLEKEYGYGWEDYLPVPYDDLIEKNEIGGLRLKLVDGVTKEYKNFSKVSIIFGIMEEYRDPTF